MNAYQRKITIALLIATFLSAIEATIVSTATPAIVKKLGGLDLISWVFALYLLTSAVTTPIFGKLADLFGRKKVFLVGTALFLIGSLLCGLSQNMGQLILFRAIQGIGAGAVIPITFTIIGDIFSFEQRAKVQGLFSSVWGIAGLFGPLVGGFLVDYVSWHWIFFINLPFGLISMWIIGKYLEENIEKQERKIDYGGAITFTIGTTALLYLLLAGGTSFQWNSVITYVLLIISFVFLWVFVRIQIKHTEPIIPIKLFSYREILVANLVSFLASAILIGLTTYIPLWIQNVLLKGATFSGFVLFPMSIGWPLGATIGSRLLIKVGAKPVSLIGVCLVTLGSFALTFISISSPIWIMLGIIFIMGFGFGLSITTFTIVVQSAVGWNLRGVATSSNTFVRTFGQTLGVAVLGTFLNQQLGVHTDSASQVPSQSLATGIHNIFLIMAGIAVISLVVTFWVPKKRKEEQAA
ncbi:Multidrug resistance protein 3 [Bacillus subtilis]|uniref:MDR family MFS transporter n=1 Tax=Bacillus subtilis TaxID=1423 RepID=UPI0006A84D60|nr:MDR family MFS transporter [Bacillus subtilis]CUB20503.1 Multidrug resistance protein 3 [Bacillus subtilis]CUB47955.1 Multidrug resistance protein 3 [Bacillus subtilis]CUB57476.1 Multidrug resistance protein 3 [Bacillus subtilis]